MWMNNRQPQFSCDKTAQKEGRFNPVFIVVATKYVRCPYIPCRWVRLHYVFCNISLCTYSVNTQRHIIIICHSQFVRSGFIDPKIHTNQPFWIDAWFLAKIRFSFDLFIVVSWLLRTHWCVLRMEWGLEIGMKTTQNVMYGLYRCERQKGRKWERDRDITQNWNKLEITITVGEKVN